jgi:hypothetical protein
MPHPSTVHVDSALSTFISGSENGNYFADVASPVIETDKRSDAFQKFLKKDTMTIREAAFPPTGKANEADYDLETDNFSVKDYALSGYVSLAEILNADEPHRPLEKRARFLMNNILLGREFRVASAFHTNGNYASSNYAGAAAVWSDTSNANPIQDIDIALAALAPGMEETMETILILAQPVWLALRRHPAMLGGGALAATLSVEQAAATLGVDRILVSKAQYNTTPKAATASYAHIWDPTAAVLVRRPVGEPEGETGLFLASFRWTGNASGEPVMVRRWQSPERGAGGSETIQVELAEDIKVVQNDMAYRITGVLA